MNVIDPTKRASVERVRWMTQRTQTPSRLAPDPVRSELKPLNVDVELKRHFKRLPAFRKCGNCGNGTVYRAYQPSVHGFEYWCYTCGAKDEMTRKQVDPAIAVEGRSGGKYLSAEMRRKLVEELRKRGVEVK